MPAAWLLLDSSAPPRVVRAADRPRMDGPGGAYLTEVDAGTSRDVCILEAVVPPGTGTGVHAHHGDEHHLVLAGRWRMTQGEHTFELGPGDYLAWDPSVPHDVENIGDEPGRILVIYPRQGRRAASPDTGGRIPLDGRADGDDRPLVSPASRPRSDLGERATRTRAASRSASHAYSSGRL